MAAARFLGRRRMTVRENVPRGGSLGMTTLGITVPGMSFRGGAARSISARILSSGALRQPPGASGHPMGRPLADAPPFTHPDPMHLKTVLRAALATAAFPLSAAAQQMRVPGPPAVDPATLSDEFDAPASLAGWRSHAAAEGWPEQIGAVDVGRTAPGALYLEPLTTGWYADFRAPFLFREVTGDFDARTRIRASGKRGPAPTVTWSLAGLMVREPRAATMETWQPRGENWLFITTGVAARPGAPVIETKTTVNGRSALNLHPVRGGWMELRVVRVGPDFLLLSREEGDAAWTLRERFFRPDLPRTVQVGINAYTGWDSMREFWNDPAAYNRQVLRRDADLAVTVDYVRFAQPQVPPALRGRRLSDFAVSNDELAAWLAQG